MSQYGVDLECMTTVQLRDLLKKTELLPSQQILKEKLEVGFDAIEKEGIKNLSQLQKVLQAKTGLAAFSAKTGISEEFLIILRREINSYNPKKRKLNEFAWVDKEFIKKLEAISIKDTQQYFDKTVTASDRKRLAQKTGMDTEPVLELTKLADVTRLRYVNQTFATLLVKAGYDSVEKIAMANDNQLYNDLKNINEKNQYVKGAVRLKDIVFLINDAKEIPRVRVEY